MLFKNRVIGACCIFLFPSICFGTNYDNVVKKMQDLAANHPKIAVMMDIGKNDSGILIQGLKIEKQPGFDVVVGKTKHLLVGVHHGNEKLGADVAIKFAEDLIQNFSLEAGEADDSWEDTWQGLEDRVLYVIPVLNIGGYNANTREERSSGGSSVDPNRDYPDVCVQQKYFQLASTSNLARFIEKEEIIGAVTVHGYIGTFTYPWGIFTDSTKTLDDSFYREVAKASVAINNYRTGTHTDIIYPAAGAFEDWAYYKFGVWTMLLEVARSPDIQKDSAAMIKYFSQLPQERSTQHQHTGNCTQTKGSFPSRP